MGQGEERGERGGGGGVGGGQSVDLTISTAECCACRSSSICYLRRCLLGVLTAVGDWGPTLLLLRHYQSHW